MLNKDRIASSAESSIGSEGSISTLPTTERAASIWSPLRAASTNWSSNSLKLRSFDVRTRPLSHIRLSALRVTETACLVIICSYDNVPACPSQRWKCRRYRVILSPTLLQFLDIPSGKRRFDDHETNTSRWGCRTDILESVRAFSHACAGLHFRAIRTCDVVG
jgi:hypothetical protein